MSQSAPRAALLFDLDGTLLHTDPLHAEVFIDLFAARGRDIDMAFYLDQLHGRQNAAIFAELCPDEDARALSEAKESAFRAKLDASVPSTPGTEALLARAEASGWGTAVVTNAPRINAEAMLDAIGLNGAFDTLVIGDECAAGKPDPAPYATAMSRLGVRPASCIAFEDSPSGLQSAAAAGAMAIGMRSSLDDDALRAAGAALSLQDFNDPALSPVLERLKGATT